jgi:outer membrane protein TolC
MKLFFMLMVLLVGCADVPLRAETLTEALATARDSNPEIGAARQAWKVAASLVPASKAWPNPTFTYIDEKLPAGNDGGSPAKIKHYRVEQMVPFPGKLSEDAQMRHHEALTAQATYQSKLLEVLGDVRMRYYQLYLTDQKIELAGRTLDALKAVLRTAQARLASNQLSTSDVFMTQLELRKIENELFQQRQARGLIEIELNTLLNRGVDTAWGPAQAPELVDLPVSVDGFKLLAQKNAPLFFAAQHEISHAQAMLKRSHFDFAPDFNLIYEHEASSHGETGRQIGVGISFPLWLQRPWNLGKSSREHVRETEALSQEMANMVLKQVYTEDTETITHLTLARNYERDLLPTALSNLRLAQDQYASGRGDFLRILEALRAWIEVHNEYQNELYHYGEHWSLLERWVGVDISKAKELLAAQNAEENSHVH